MLNIYWGLICPSSLAKKLTTSRGKSGSSTNEICYRLDFFELEGFCEQI